MLIIILEPRQFTSDAATNSAPVLSRGAGSGRAVMTALLSGAGGWRIPRGHDLMPMSSPAVSLSLSSPSLAALLHPAIRIQRSSGDGGGRAEPGDMACLGFKLGGEETTRTVSQVIYLFAWKLQSVSL